MLELFSMSKKIDQDLWVAGKIRHYENNNKPTFINCEDFSREAVVDEESPKGMTERGLPTQKKNFFSAYFVNK